MREAREPEPQDPDASSVMATRPSLPGKAALAVKLDPSLRQHFVASKADTVPRSL